MIDKSDNPAGRLNLKAQRGAALLVGLIMLLLLTLIGVAGMQDTLLQERMVATMRDRQQAQQAAEAALRYAENQIKTAASYTSVPNVVFISTTPALTRTVSTQKVNENDYWNSAAAWASGVQNFPSAGNFDNLASQPKYVIERLPNDYALIPGTLNVGAVGGQRVTDYRITVKAVGLTNNVEVILQSDYRRLDSI